MTTDEQHEAQARRSPLGHEAALLRLLDAARAPFNLTKFRVDPNAERTGRTWAERHEADDVPMDGDPGIPFDPDDWTPPPPMPEVRA